jgi:ATP:ADP antiporter, AAA family
MPAMSPRSWPPPASGPAVLAAALLVGPQVAARATRDALFLSHFAVSSLPVMTATAALVSLAGTLAFSRAMTRLSPARLLPAAMGVSAALFLAEWGLATPVPRLAAVLVFLHHAILGAVLVSGFWSLVTESFDPHRAKQAMGPIGAGASLGGVAGGLLTWRAATMGSVPSMLAALAAMNVLALFSLLPLTRGAARAEARSVPAEVPARVAARSGLAIIRETPYLRGLAALVALSAFVEALLDYLLGAAATTAVGRGPALMSFFALFHAGTGLLALIVQAVFVRPLLSGAGLTVTLAALPAFTLVAAGAALLYPRLASLVALRGGHAVLRNSAFRSGYELLYAPLPAESKRPTKVIIDVACDRLGTVAGSAAVLLVVFFARGASPRVLLAVASVAAAAAIVLAPRFHRGYVGALAESLRAREPMLDPTALVEPTTLLTVASIQRDLPRAVPTASAAGATVARDPVVEAIADLRSGDSSRIARALSGPTVDSALVAHIVPMLVDDTLFPMAADALRRASARCSGQLLDALLDPTLDAAVRRRVARVLKGVPTQRAADGLLLALEGERFDLRYRCAQALVRIRADNPAVVLPAARVLEVAMQEARAAGRSPRHLDHVFNVLSITLDRRPLAIALRALRGSDVNLRGTALEYLDNVLPPALRERIWPALAHGETPASTGRSPDEMRDELLRSMEK